MADKRLLEEHEGLKEAEDLDKEQGLVEEIRNRTIDWEQYVKTNTISQRELGLLRDFDKEDPENQADMLEERGEEYAALFIKCLTNMHSEETVQYLVTLVNELLIAHPEQVYSFHSLIAKDVNPFTPLLRCLDKSDQYTIHKAAHILSKLFCTDVSESESEINEFLNWLTQQLRELQKPNTSESHTIAILMAVKGMLHRHEYHASFIKLGGFRYLMNSFRAETQNKQIMYVCSFCIWLLSFNDENLHDLKEAEVVRRLAEIVKRVIREKVVRVAFGTLKNLLGKKVDLIAFSDQMIYAGLVPVLHGLKNRKWKDEDLIADIHKVDVALQLKFVDLSSFEKYTAEVSSGELSWTPVHTEKFWRENAVKFEADNYLHISQLVGLLREPRSTLTTLEVACYDLGEFARMHPDGKSIIRRLKGKTLMMNLMSHKEPRVQKHALLGVQKLMVNNWEFLVRGEN